MVLLIMSRIPRCNGTCAIGLTAVVLLMASDTLSSGLALVAQNTPTHQPENSSGNNRPTATEPSPTPRPDSAASTRDATSNPRPAKVFVLHHRVTGFSERSYGHGGLIVGKLLVDENRIEWRTEGECSKWTVKEGSCEVKKETKLSTADGFNAECKDVERVYRAGQWSSFKGGSLGGHELHLDLLARNYLFHAKNDQDRDAIILAVQQACPKLKDSQR